ncbi:hypothetical protein [Domibacillus aminovorans]|uniref:Uncharacterized protein n=1 Tax=Domibacillus aminovorans TaxID=29332 RepID=A0A177L9W4_9BACI|nr:hypothetical protein [Domibacillus aminovorans]OAH62550.1 hypothetical protein AWH49_09435 [Domibacillus aminovorans]
MKRWFLVIVVGILSACSSDEERFVQEVFPEEVSAIIEEPSEEELAELMREEAEPAVFTALNIDKPPVDKKVTATGEVTRVTEPGMMGTFSLSTDDGTYTIMNLTKTEVEEGSKVTIYGVVAVEKAADGTPTINAVIIE